MVVNEEVLGYIFRERIKQSLNDNQKPLITSIRGFFMFIPSLSRLN